MTEQMTAAKIQNTEEKPSRMGSHTYGTVVQYSTVQYCTVTQYRPAMWPS